MALRLFFCLLLLSSVSFFALSCPAAAPQDWLITQSAQPGFFPGKVWTKIARPELMGWDSKKLRKARLYSRRFGSGAVMIVQDGVVVDAWGNLDTNFKCHSVRKSLISAQYGIHSAMGSLKLDATLAGLEIDDDPPLSEQEKSATVRDLLMARSGVYLPALGESPMMRYQKPARHSHPPGEHWYYNNWDFNALGTIFRRETGRDIFKDFARRIGSVIGMQDFDPDKCSYISRDRESGSLGPELRHQYYNFRMSARDLARFGLLYLRMGRWKDAQVVPEKWVRESTSPLSKVRKDAGYGYLWWCGTKRGFLPGLNVAEPCYQASGFRGQNLIVMPYRKLLVVHRVDTDHSPYSVSSHALGRLMWLILDAAGAGEIGEARFLAAAPGKLLDASSLGSLIGKEVVLSPVKQPRIQLRLNAKGGFRIEEAGSGKLLQNGRWWPEGDYFLSRLEGKKEECVQVKMSGELVYTFNMYGALLQSYKVISKRE